jgi:nucleoside-diphosphate-sugar epimerase
VDLPSARNRRAAKVQRGRVELAWGDIRETAWLSSQLQDVAAVIHLAALLPPATENRPELAEAVNVTATKRLVDLLARSPGDPLFLYPSSLTVFGLTQGRTPPRKSTDPAVATDAYTRHKLAVEAHLAASPISWVVFRIGVSVDSRTLSADASVLRKMVAVRADNRLEYVHPQDVALAMVNALEKKDAVKRRTLLIGGGRSCQVTQSIFLGAAIGALGLRWSEHHHGSDEYYTDWLESDESQRLLDYQRRSFDDYRLEMAQRLRWPRWLLWPLRPLLNPALAAFTERMKRREGRLPPFPSKPS